MSVDHDALQERTRGARAALWRLAGPWWLFLLTGIAWLVIAWAALRFTPASITTVGVLLGVLFLFAMIDEFVLASVVLGTFPQAFSHLPLTARQRAADVQLARSSLAGARAVRSTVSAQQV